MLVEDLLVSDLEPFDVSEDLLPESDFVSDFEPSPFVSDFEPSPVDSDFESEAFTVDDVEDSALRLSLR